MDVTFSFGALSDVGLIRSGNQDSGYAGPRLLVLADGMGGPAGGDIASSIAVACLAPLDTDPVPADQMMNRLRSALQEAHDELVDRAAVDPSLKGLGTTCIALLRSGNKLAMVHIGDSRAYLLREGFLTQVTTDHSFVQYLVDTGQITQEEAERHPKRSVILRVLGDSEGVVNADESFREAVAGDRWLLCSDGLSGVVSADTIAGVLSTVPDPASAVAELVNLALLAGAPDNVTCVLADVVPVDSQPDETPLVVGAAATDRLSKTRGGGGAAAKAAALAAVNATEPADGDEEDEPRRKPWWRWLWIPVVAILLGVVVVGGWFGYQWSQSHYYAVAEDGNVVAYQGVPGWPFSSEMQVGELSLTDLTKSDQLRLKEPVTFESESELREYLEGLSRSAARLALTSSAAQSGAQSGSSSTAPQSGR